MIKHRVIPTMLYKDLALVKGTGFDSWRTVSTAMEGIRVYTLRGVDELIFLDISATNGNRRPDVAVIQGLTDSCNVPFSYGGGIRSLGDVQELILEGGADKVVVNSAAFERPELITEIAAAFGSQCVIASVDAAPNPAMADGYEAHTHSGTRPTGVGVVELAKQYEKAGAGEICLTSIPRDGTMEGYDIELISKVSSAVSIPVIASGGAGSADDFHAALTEGGAQAVAASAMYVHAGKTPRAMKQELARRGIPVRL